MKTRYTAEDLADLATTIHANSELEGACRRIITQTAFGTGSFTTRFQKAIKEANLLDHQASHIDYDADRIIADIKTFSYDSAIKLKEVSYLFDQLFELQKQAYLEYEAQLTTYCKQTGKYPWDSQTEPTLAKAKKPATKRGGRVRLIDKSVLTKRPKPL